MHRFSNLIPFVFVLFAGCSCQPREQSNDRDSEVTTASTQRDTGKADAQGKSSTDDSDGETPIAESDSSTRSATPYATNQDANDAYRESSKQYARAKESAKKGEFGKAYSATLEAWLLVKDKDDAECKSLSGELLRSLENFGERANSTAGQIDKTSKRIIVK